MAQYDTITKQITDDITVTISKKKDGTAGERLEAFLKWLSEKIVDPGYGKPEGGGGRPDQGLPPSGNRPDNSLPGSGGRPDNSLPGGGGRPDQGLPGGGGSGGRPDNTLPGQGGRPDNSLPGAIGENAKEIAKLVLGKCFDCKDDGSAQPKR